MKVTNNVLTGKKGSVQKPKASSSPLVRKVSKTVVPKTNDVNTKLKQAKKIIQKGIGQ